MNQSHYQSNEFHESDWKLFRRKIAGWQEDYMGKLNEEYLALLRQPEKSSEKFWTLEKRINRDKKRVGVIIDMRRSTMIDNILELLHDEVIEMNDLNDFSETLKETINAYRNHFR